MARSVAFLTPGVRPGVKPKVTPNLDVLAGVDLGDVSESLRAKKVSFRVEWPSFKAFIEEIEVILRTRFGVAETDYWNLNSDDMSPYMHGGRANVARVSGFLDRLARNAQCAVLGLAN